MRRSARRFFSDAPAARIWAPVLALLSVAGFLTLAFDGSTRAHRLDGYRTTRVEGSSFPKTLVTGSTKRVLSRPPNHIASLNVTADEILVQLVAPERLVAVSRFADDPSISMCAADVPKTAARIRGLDPEGIIAMRPDVVFVAHYNLDSGVRLLEGADIAAVRFRDVHSYADVEANVRATAAAVGEDARGDRMIRDLRARLDGIRRSVLPFRRPRVLYYSPVDYTSGTDTLVDEKIRIAGGANVGDELGLVGYQSISLDVMVGLDPEIIVVPRWSEDATTPVRELTRSAAWRNVAAVRMGRVYAVSAAALTSEAPSGAVGADELAHLFHPEAFAR